MSVAVFIDRGTEQGFHACLAALASLAERLPEFRDSLLSMADRPADILRLEDSAAPPAGERLIRFEPADPLKVLTAAIRASERDFEIVEFACHGWPVLSVGDRTSTVTGSGEGSNPLPADGDA